MGVIVVLVRPETAGNVGAVGRLMANFDVNELVLVSPKCDHLSKEALDRAKHSKDVLRNARVVSSISDVKADLKVATTSQIGSDFNISRTPLAPRELAQHINSSTVAFVFGPEGPGLSNKEVSACDFVCAIPTSKRYASMNLSHAVAIVLYEVFAACGKDSIVSSIKPMSDSERKQIIKMAESVIGRLDWGTEGKSLTQKKLWHNIAGKVLLSKREAFALMGFLRQLLRKL